MVFLVFAAALSGCTWRTEPYPTSPAATSVERTFTPLGSIDLPLPARDEVWVNPDVVARRGVPADLRDAYWATWNGDAGLLGTTAQIGLPAGETVETIRDGLVISARWPAGPAAELELVVREFATGTTVRVIRTALRTVDADLFGARLFWTGVMAGDPEVVVDGGTWSTEAREEVAPIAIVEPGATLSGELCGKGLDRSPSGLTISIRTLCAGSRLWTDVIDTATQVRTARLEGDWILALTDDTLLLADFVPTETLPLGQGGVTAVDRATGDVLWRFPDRAEIAGFASGHWVALGSSFMTHAHWLTPTGQQVVLSAFDARSGVEHELLRQQDGPAALWATFESSSAAHLVLTAGFDLRAQIRLAGTPVSLLAIEDASLERDAFEIDPPQLCDAESCREG